MFGPSRSVTLAIVGWLWADILLGLFVIFLAAASPPLPATAATGPSIDPDPIVFEVEVSGSLLLGTDPGALASEQSRFAEAVRRELASRASGRRVALIFAFGSHASPQQGEELARRATSALTGGVFEGAVIKDLHDIVPGDTGTKVALEIYVYR